MSSITKRLEKPTCLTARLCSIKYHSAPSNTEFFAILVETRLRSGRASPSLEYTRSPRLPVRETAQADPNRILPTLESHLLGRLCDRRIQANVPDPAAACICREVSSSSDKYINHSLICIPSHLSERCATNHALLNRLRP